MEKRIGEVNKVQKVAFLESKTADSMMGSPSMNGGVEKPFVAVTKSSPEMRGRGSVSTGFSSRSCPFYKERGPRRSAFLST